MQRIELLQNLKVFSEPDTQSESLGMLGQGIYQLLEIKNNYPTRDTDYVKLYEPSSLGRVWICSRYTDTEYAKIIHGSATHETDFQEDTMAIDEKHLIGQFDTFTPFTYDLKDPYYPYEIEGLKVPLAPPLQNNCCTFVEALLVKAWQEALDNFSWGNKEHGQMMIMSADDYFSPITCLVEREMAVHSDSKVSTPEPWTVVQGWRSQWGGGHTFIILDYDAATDRVLTLESNKAFQLDGVGYRAIGNLKDYPHPGANWADNEKLWTWSRFRDTYKFNQMAQLKVKNIGWIADRSSS